MIMFTLATYVYAIICGCFIRYSCSLEDNHGWKGIVYDIDKTVLEPEEMKTYVQEETDKLLNGKYETIASANIHHVHSMEHTGDNNETNLDGKESTKKDPSITKNIYIDNLTLINISDVEKYDNIDANSESDGAIVIKDRMTHGIAIDKENDDHTNSGNVAKYGDANVIKNVASDASVDNDEGENNSKEKNVEEKSNIRKSKHLPNVYFVSKSRTMIVIRTYGDTFKTCEYSNHSISDKTVQLLNEIEVQESSMDELISLCKEAKTIVARRRKKRFIEFIYPGTKWCGMGNIAENNRDLGELKDVDTCCRTHDKCKPQINPFQTKYGLFNFAIWTKKHCDCDSAFFECLKNVGTEDSDYLGNVFFNVISVGCIDKVYPQKCVKWNWFGGCKKSKKDKSKPKAMAFIDNTLVY